MEDVEAVIVSNTSLDRVRIDFAKLAARRDTIRGPQFVQRTYDVNRIGDNACIQSDIDPIFSDFNSSSSVVVRATVNSEFVNILLDTGMFNRFGNVRTIGKISVY